MKYCSKCGQSIPDNAKFCSYCGEVVNDSAPEQESTSYYKAPVNPAPVTSREDEQKCLDGLFSRLKWEHLAWKISGFVFLGLTIVLVLCGLIGSIASGVLIADNVSYSYEYYDGEYYFDEDYGRYSDNTDGEDVVGVIGIAYGTAYMFAALIGILPVSIVSLVMASKVKKYRNKLYTDCTDGYNHATSVGSIVIAALFNEVALVFVIINFILTKTKRAEFDSIKAAQAKYNAQF